VASVAEKVVGTLRATDEGGDVPPDDVAPIAIENSLAVFVGTKLVE
jgi:hypothetical protein